MSPKRSEPSSHSGLNSTTRFRRSTRVMYACPRRSRFQRRSSFRRASAALRSDVHVVASHESRPPTTTLSRDNSQVGSQVTEPASFPALGHIHERRSFRLGPVGLHRPTGQLAAGALDGLTRRLVKVVVAVPDLPAVTVDPSKDSGVVRSTFHLHVCRVEVAFNHRLSLRRSSESQACV